MKFFNITKILSKYLQYVDVCVCAARCKVNAVEKSLKDLRTDSEFQKFWREAEKLSKKLDLEAPQLPRPRRIPLKLGGEIQPVYRSVEHYYKLTSYFPLLDTIISQLQERFSENDMDIIQNIETVLLADTRGVSQEILEDVAQFYEFDQDNLKAELRVFANLVKEVEQEKGSATDPGQGDSKRYKTLCELRTIFAEDKAIQVVLPVLCRLTKIFWTIPITSCSAERSFSCLRHLKSYLRSTMGQERLSTLALLEIEKDITPDIQKVVEKFALKSNRKLKLSYSAVSTC